MKSRLQGAILLTHEHIGLVEGKKF